MFLRYNQESGDDDMKLCPEIRAGLFKGISDSGGATLPEMQEALNILRETKSLQRIVPYNMRRHQEQLIDPTGLLRRWMSSVGGTIDQNTDKRITRAVSRLYRDNREYLPQVLQQETAFVTVMRVFFVQGQVISRLGWDVYKTFNWLKRLMYTCIFLDLLTYGTDGEELWLTELMRYASASLDVLFERIGGANRDEE